MKSIEGFKEQYGLIEIKEDFVRRKLFDSATSYGYQKISLPILENALSFSESVVGRSPWPEWNRRGCFYLHIENYLNNYDEEPEREAVLLIPEGTVSVTRWLANQMEKGEIRFPLRLFYSLKCYRNELLEKLSKTKKREFEQFGLEILGSSNVFANVEIMYLIYNCLKNLNIPKDAIRLRINDVSIFVNISKDQGISEDDIYVLKELLDSLAEVKAYKDDEKIQIYRCKINKILSKYHLSQQEMDIWALFMQNSYNDFDNYHKYIPEKYHQYIESLKDIHLSLKKFDINVCVDLAVIRSHEYYSGISFEVDILDKETVFIEIAGGGQYDRLVGSFLKKIQVNTVPCTGFSFGFERLMSVLEHYKFFDVNKSITSYFNFLTSPKGLPLDNIESIDNFLKDLAKGE